MTPLLVRFLAAGTVALGVAWVDSAGALRGVSEAFVGGYVVENLYLLLPVVVGISLASFRHARRREAALLVAGATLLMVALDFVPASGVATSRAQMVQMNGALVQNPLRDRWNAAGALPLVIRHLRGDVPGAALDPRPAYSDDHPRIRVARAYARAGFLLLPLAVGGLVLGGIRWMDRTMLFTSRASELGVEFVLGWLVPPLLLLATVEMTHQTVSMVLFDRLPIPSILLPLVTLVGLGLGGWAAAGPGDGE